MGGPLYFTPVSAKPPVLAKMGALNGSSQNFPSGGVFVTLTNWTTTEFDTAAGLVPATGLYTVPADGYYLVNAGILTNGVPQGSDVFLSIMAGATEKRRGAIATPPLGGTEPNGAASVGGVIRCSKNDVLRIALTQFTGSTIVLFSGAICNYWSIAQQL